MLMFICLIQWDKNYLFEKDEKQFVEFLEKLHKIKVNLLQIVLQISKTAFRICRVARKTI